MSESSSGVNTSSNSFSKSYSSHCSDLSDSNTPLPVVSSRGVLQQRCDSGISSPLPCDAFKYLTWHKLKEHDVQGTQIQCPRVREGPSSDELVMRGEAHLLQEEIHVTDKEIWQQRLQENWENCVNVNLSFQGLGDPYQQRNFHRILRRLIRVERLWLVDNALKDLSAIRLPRVFSSLPNLEILDGLPKLPEDWSTSEESGFLSMKKPSYYTLLKKTSGVVLQQSQLIRVRHLKHAWAGRGPKGWVGRWSTQLSGRTKWIWTDSFYI
ncbi:hypothetical protein FKM82_004107 [Ascaphus truei]